MNEAIFAQVRQIAADTFELPVEQITLESSPETLEGWDSLRHVNLMLALEQTFNMEILPEEMEEILSIEAIVTLLQEKLLAMA